MNWRTVTHGIGRHKKSSIQSLPAELLLIIFKFVHDAVLLSENDGIWGEHWCIRDPLSPFLFPYSIAAVCPLWRAVASMVPEFWTRVVVLVDKPPTPLSDIHYQLSWSRELPLDVTVTRRGPRHTIDEPHEKIWAYAAMSMIRPHLRRCTSVRFNVKLSSSLPSFPNDFPAPVPNLRRLELQCSEDDSGGTARLTSITSAEQAEYKFPALARLIIDGRNYYDACRKASPIEWAHMFPNLLGLAVSRFKSGPRDSFTARDLMSPLVELPLESLRITDLDLAPLPSRSDPIAVLDHLSFLALEDLPIIERMNDILDFLSTVDEITMTRCVTSHLPTLSTYDAELRLDDIGIHHDLAPVLLRWQGRELDVNNCSGFNNAVLALMSARNAETGRFIYARYVRRLRITDCPCFTVAALKHLVDVRRKPPAQNPANIPLTTHFRELSVTGDVPRLSSEDRHWFHDLVPDFRYHSNNDDEQ